MIRNKLTNQNDFRKSDNSSLQKVKRKDPIFQNQINQQSKKAIQTDKPHTQNQSDSSTQRILKSKDQTDSEMYKQLSEANTEHMQKP